MATPMEGEQLAAQRYVSLVIRLVCGGGGHMRGHLIDTSNGSVQRFGGLTGLLRAIRQWSRRNR